MLVFTFSADVVAADGILGANEFTVADAVFRSAHIVGRVLTVELEGVRDGARVNVSVHGLAGVNGRALTGDADVEVRALYADANRDGAVGADALAVRGRGARRGAAHDLLYDLDLDGVVGAGELALVRRRVGQSALIVLQATPVLRAAYVAAAPRNRDPDEMDSALPGVTLST